MAHAERTAEASSAKVKAAGRKLALVGAFREETVARMDEEMVPLGVVASVVPRCEEAPEAFASAEPIAVVVRMDAPRAEQTFAYLRGQARFAQVPLFGVPGERNDLAFTELFSWGGDDLVSLSSPQSLVRRLRPLAARPGVVSGEWRAAQGTAIVAGCDARWRSVMGRALHNGGFVVRFVASSDDLEKESAGEGLRLVVAVDDLAPEAALEKARARGSDAAWVIVAPPKKMAATHAAIERFGRVSVADGYAPPENVLFLANELLNQRGIDKRASARLLYGTSIAFRVAGRDEDEIGFSYNVSAGGVYVRTLAAIDAGQDVWLEMWPPRSERRVRLCGRVAWKRAYGPQERATVPAGFGVQITEGLAGDFDRWRAGYQAFAESLLGARVAAK